MYDVSEDPATQRRCARSFERLVKPKYQQRNPGHSILQSANEPKSLGLK